MSTQKGTKPIAIAINMAIRNITSFPPIGGFRIEYMCGRCHTPFSLWFHTNELFCHHCGEKVDWSVVTYINSKQSNKLMDSSPSKQEELKIQYLGMINKINTENNFEHEVFIGEEAAEDDYVHAAPIDPKIMLELEEIIKSEEERNELS